MAYIDNYKMVVEINVTNTRDEWTLPFNTLIHHISGNVICGGRHHYFTIDTTEKGTPFGINGGKIFKYRVTYNNGANTLVERRMDGTKTVPHNTVKDRAIAEAILNALKEKFN